MRVPLEQAADICGVKPGTIYRWVSDGRILKYPPEEEWDTRSWYDVDELLHWIDARNPDALWTRAGIGGPHAAQLRKKTA